jgi:MurNAc alpha-1-phosphate uridylyltransferase
VNHSNIDTAMVLAAGLGARMRPLTDDRPKPMVEVAGRMLIDRVLDRIAEAGVPRAVVNVHYFADLLRAHLATRTAAPGIEISDERDCLLDTGGGIVRALPLLGAAPFLLVNSDSIWLEGASPNLPRLIHAFDAATMDAVLLLAPASGALGYAGRGDFAMNAQGRLTRRGNNETAPYVYAGAAVLSPAMFRDAPTGAFSLTKLFARSENESRLYGLPLEGLWMHVGTPDAIPLAEDAIARAAG